MFEKDILYEVFQKLRIDEKLLYLFGEKVVVNLDDIICLKIIDRSVIYKLFVKKKFGIVLLILKVYKFFCDKNKVEINMYSKVCVVLGDLMLDIYFIEENGWEMWIFMEFVSQIRGQFIFYFKYFWYIILFVVELYSCIFENKKIFDGKWWLWLLVYELEIMRKGCKKQIKKIVELLDWVFKDD